MEEEDTNVHNIIHNEDNENDNGSVMNLHSHSHHHHHLHHSLHDLTNDAVIQQIHSDPSNSNENSLGVHLSHHDPTSLENEVHLHHINSEMMDHSSLVSLAHPPPLVTVNLSTPSASHGLDSLTPLPEPSLGGSSKKRVKRQREESVYDKNPDIENYKLKAEKEELEMANKELTHKLREHENYKKVMKNLVEFFGSLPQTSPLRQPLYKVIVKDLSYETAHKLFNISATTWKRIKKVELTPLMIKSLPNQSRKKVSDEERDKFRSILDVLLPFSHGRNYRVQSKTTKDLYEDYKRLCTERGAKMFSKSYFRRQLKMENIHHKKLNTGKSDLTNSMDDQQLGSEDQLQNTSNHNHTNNNNTYNQQMLHQHSIQLATPIPLQALQTPTLSLQAPSLSLQLSSQSSLPFGNVN